MVYFYLFRRFFLLQFQVQSFFPQLLEISQYSPGNSRDQAGCFPVHTKLLNHGTMVPTTLVA